MVGRGRGVPGCAGRCQGGYERGLVEAGWRIGCERRPTLVVLGGEESGVGVTIPESRVLEYPSEKRQVRSKTEYDISRERVDGATACPLASFSPDGQLGQQGVIVHRDGVALGHAGINPNPRSGGFPIEEQRSGLG